MSLRTCASSLRDHWKTVLLIGFVLCLGLYSAPNQIDVLLKIRDMWTFNKHKESVSDHYSFVASTTPGTVLSTINVSICGNKLLVRLEYGGATPRAQQLLINWKTLHAAVSQTTLLDSRCV